MMISGQKKIVDYIDDTKNRAILFNEIGRSERILHWTWQKGQEIYLHIMHEGWMQFTYISWSTMRYDVLAKCESND